MKLHFPTTLSFDVWFFCSSHSSPCSPYTRAPLPVVQKLSAGPRKLQLSESLPFLWVKDLGWMIKLSTYYTSTWIISLDQPLTVRSNNILMGSNPRLSWRDPPHAAWPTSGSRPKPLGKQDWDTMIPVFISSLEHCVPSHDVFHWC